MARISAVLTAVAVLTAACGGSGDVDQPEAAQPDSDVDHVAAVATTREVTQVVVIGANASSFDAIREALMEFDVGPSLEQVMIVGVPSCDDTGAQLAVCRSAPEPLDPTNGRHVLVVLDDDFAAAAEAADVIGGQLSMVVSGDPDEDAAALAGLSSSITFVPPGLSDLIADPAVTLFVAVDDALAAFTPTVVGENQPASLVNRFFDSRLQEVGRESDDVEDPQDSVPEPDVRWVLDLPEPLTAQGSHERAVVVDNVVAFLGNDEVVRGVDTESATVLWTRSVDTDPLGGARSFVSASGNTILLTSTAPGRNPDPEPDIPERSLWALDIRTGDLLWEFAVSADSYMGHPATDGERVFVWIGEGDLDATLRALDLADGTEVWRTEGTAGVGPPRVDNGEVWVGSEDGALRGFDAVTGIELTRFDRIGLGLAGVASQPATTDDRVFFGNDNGTFYAIDRVSGDLDWSFATESPNLPSSPVIADDLVIFGAFDGGVYGLDIDTGELRWRYDSAESPLFLSSAALAGDTVYIASLAAPASLLALDARTGEPVWELPVGEGVGASPIVDGDTVYIQTPGKFWAVVR